MSQNIPLSRDHRGLLLQLGEHLNGQGTDAFLDRFDYQGVTPHQTYAVGLGRLPESAHVAVMPTDYKPREQLTAMLRSREFQSELIQRVVRALPEKRRLFFVHVPKCAGTDLAAYLMRDFAHLAQRDQDPNHIPNATLPAHLQAFMQRVMAREELVVMGHIGLNWIVTERLLRYGDASFSIVREPVSMAISKVNYVLTQLLGRGDNPPAHFPAWMEMLGLQDFPQVMDDTEAKACALALLHNEKVVPHNNICRFLGRDTADSAFDLCAATNIELTTVTRYEAWLQQRWGIAGSARANESRKYLTRADLAAADLEYIRGITREDQIFYARVEQALVTSGKASIFGAAL